MHEYVMPVARRSALRRRGRRPAGTTRRRAHGAIPPNEGATRQARAGPPADTDYRRQSRPNGPRGDVARRAARSDLRRCLRMPGGPPHGIAEYWRRSGRRRSMHDGRRQRAPPRTPCARRDAAPAGTPARECATRGRRSPERTALARNRRDYDRARRVEDQFLRQDEPPKGRARGRPTRRRDATRGALADLHARRADAPRSPAPARPASPGRETLIATE